RSAGNARRGMRRPRRQGRYSFRAKSFLNPALSFSTKSQLSTNRRLSGLSAMNSELSQMNAPPNPTRHLARLTFIAFLLTFIAARTLVILIMTRRMPDLFLHLGGTHVHHLNYGIFLLSTICGVLLFARLNRAQRDVCALVYGIGL